MKKIFKLVFYSILIYYFSFPLAIAKPFTKFISIETLKSKKTIPEFFEVTGYVVKKYQCPICPPDKKCKPCMKENIVISDQNKQLNLYTLSNKELIIFTRKIESFDLGVKYTFVLRKTDQASTNETFNDLELVSSKIAK